MSDDKKKRQQKIVALIRSRPIATQEELVGLLLEHGVEATQTSVSRDLDELGIIKRNARYILLPDFARAVGPESILIARAGDALLVARCGPGMASAVAREIDAQAAPEIAGTIAGDDTVFIATASRKAQTQAITRLKKLFIVEGT